MYSSNISINDCNFVGNNANLNSKGLFIGFSNVSLKNNYFEE